MLTETYIDALLVDEDFADQVWEAWDKREIDDTDVCFAWLKMANGCQSKSDFAGGQIWSKM